MTLGWAIITTGLPHTGLRQCVGRPRMHRLCFDDNGHGCTRDRPATLRPGLGGGGGAVSTDGQTAERLPASSLAGQSQLA